MTKWCPAHEEKWLPSGSYSWNKDTRKKRGEKWWWDRSFQKFKQSKTEPRQDKIISIPYLFSTFPLHTALRMWHRQKGTLSSRLENPAPRASLFWALPFHSCPMAGPELLSIPRNLITKFPFALLQFPHGHGQADKVKEFFPFPNCSDTAPTVKKQT